MATTEPLQSITLTQATSSIIFSNIDPSYTDLIIVISGGSVSTSYPRLQFNGDTGNNYSRSEIYVQSTGSSIVMQCLQNEPGCYFHTGGFTSQPETITLQINNYSSTVFNKTVFSRYGNLTTSGGGYGAGSTFSTWRNTSAINSINVNAASNADQFAAGMVVSLYGVKSGSQKAFGGQLYTDGNYWYHVFTQTQTFTPITSLTADILVVAGGGGGGHAATGYINRAGGGGGAGGLLAHSSQSLTAQSYTVTIGGGGAGGISSNNTYPVAGSNSQFGSLTASVGGGFGGSPGVTNGSSGGSGGGAADNNGPGSATSGQGFAGGVGFDPGSGTTYSGGGGGGSGAAGSAGSSGSGGAGGIGSTTYSSWGSITNTGTLVSSNYVYSIGGRGGGTSPGGSGAMGAANTGNGGGGAYSQANGSAGGSGIVIVRYAV
jgi:hypothetical protein